MTTAGQAHLQAIQEDLACPSCEYNLRGLRGQIVQCPECGTRIDTADLIAQRWQIPWQKAPGFGLIGATVFPMALVIMVLSIIVLASIDMPSGALPGVLLWAATLCAVPLLAWGLLVWRVYVKLDGRWGIMLCLAAHLVVAGYCICCWGGLILLGITIFADMLVPMRMVTGLFAAGCIAGMFFLRCADRAIGTALIGRYLRHQTPEP